MRLSIVLLLVVILVLTGCAAPTQVSPVTVVPSATISPSPTATLPPTPTFTPEPTTPPGYTTKDGKLIGPDGEPVLDQAGNAIPAEQVVTDENGWTMVLNNNQPTLVIDPETEKTYPVNIGMVDVGSDRYHWNGSEWELIPNEWLESNGICYNPRLLIDGHIKLNEASPESLRQLYERLLRGLLRLMRLDGGQEGGLTWQGLKGENGNGFANIDEAYAYALTGKPVTGFRIPYGIDDEGGYYADGRLMQLTEVLGEVRLDSICFEVLSPGGFWSVNIPKINMVNAISRWGSWGAVGTESINGRQVVVIKVGSLDERNNNKGGYPVLTTDPGVNDPETLAKAAGLHASYLLTRFENDSWVPNVYLEQGNVDAFRNEYVENVLEGIAPFVGR